MELIKRAEEEVEEARAKTQEAKAEADQKLMERIGPQS
jgi:hypothetical protein